MKKDLAKAISLGVFAMSVCVLSSPNYVNAEEVLDFGDFIQMADAGGVISVTNITTVNPKGPDKIIGNYKINVAKGYELTLNNLNMSGTIITGNGDIIVNGENLLMTRHDGYGKIDKATIIANNLTANTTYNAIYTNDEPDETHNYDCEARINIEVENKFTIKSDTQAIFMGDIAANGIANIKAGQLDFTTKSWIIHMEHGSGNKVYIDVKNDADFKSTSTSFGGFTNNSSDGIISVKAANINISSSLDALSAGNGNIVLEANGNNIITASGEGEPSKWGSAGNGIHAKNASISVTAINGYNQITAGYDGLSGANWSQGQAVEAPKAQIDLTGVHNIIQAKNNGAFAFGSKINIIAKDSNSITAGDGLYSNKGTIEVKADKNNIINADSNAMKVENGGSITVESGELTQMIGNVLAAEAGSAKAGFDSRDSYLLGTVTTDGGTTENSVTDLSFTDGANWYLTGDSNVSNLTLKNGFVDLTKNEKGNAHKISIDKALNGSGLFKLDLTYHDNDVTSYKKATDSDFIYIHGGDGSEQNIAFVDSVDNLGAMQNGDKLYFAKVAADAASFGQGETITKANESGIYDNTFRIDYEAAAENNLPELVNNNFDGAVALAADTDEANNTEEQSPASAYNNWFITCEKGGINPNGDSPVKSYNAGFALWRDDDTLLKRLGELRYTNDEGGVWTRVIGKKLEDNRSLGFNTHAKTVQVGYDRKDVQKDGSGTWRKGIAVGHTWADTSFGSGEGKNNYTDLSIYATNIRKHDHYWDLVARIGRIDSEYDTVYGDHGEFDNWAGSLSAEYGRKKQMNDDNWFIEPQVQLTYSYMWGDSYTTSKGIRVEQDNADSLVGRAGFVISKELESERKYPNRYYAKAFIMHEFLDGGDNTVCFGSDRFYAGSDFKDTWYVVGIGANADMGNQCTFYFDAEKNFKAHVKMPYRIEVGFRWEF